MPITINSVQFVDEWGNVTPSYVGNAGDKSTMLINVSSNIYASSVANPFLFDLVSGVITSGFDFEMEGFRVGQLLEAYKLNASGAPISVYNTVVTYCQGNEIKLTTVQVPDTANQEGIAFIAINKPRESVDCFLNHIQNTSTNGIDSLIDGEATRFKFLNIHLLSIGSSQNATIVGNQSGQYLQSALIRRIAESNPFSLRYVVEVKFINSGIYNADWFASSDCLKVLFKQAWSVINNDPTGQTEFLFNNNANTGWFNQGHNSDPIDSMLLQGIASLDYAQPTPFSIVFEGPTSQLGIGASYIPLADSYFKNKLLPQDDLGMVIGTTNLSVSTISSAINPDGAQYSIQITGINTVGMITTVTGNFIPDSQFTDFMDAAEDGDRSFKLWVKCGNVNLLAFDGQLTKTPPIVGPLIMSVSKGFIDHADNTNGELSTVTTQFFDTEDNLAYFGKFLMRKNDNYESLIVRIKAINDITLESFTLQQTIFSLATTQINQGVYLIDQTISINPQLPTTSFKRDAVFKRDPSIDTGSRFGASIYYPIILDWRYWLPQSNASSVFYPNQTKNWQLYSGSVADWVVSFELELISNGLAYTHERVIFINDYDASEDIESEIELEVLSSGLIVPNPVYGEIHILRAIHTKLTGNWSINTWGENTIEPKESSPRSISSTVIDYDNNASNPLIPESGFTKSQLITAGNIAVVECLVDFSKVSASNDSITAKIKDLELGLEGNKTTAPDDQTKTTSPDDSDIKTMAP